jgi:isoamylase
MGRDWAREDGTPWPLGATYVPGTEDWNFALYSRHAASVVLLLFSADDLTHPARTVAFDPLRNRTGRVWHLRLTAEQLTRVRYYAYSVDGPSDPGNGLHFDSQKVLLDPYAIRPVFPSTFDRAAAARPGSNAGQAPVAELPTPRPAFDWTGDRRPRHTSDLIIYELHVRGFTMSPSSGVSTEKRGSYAGLAERIPYLKELGVTAVELLPVFQYCAEAGGNYWGYMPISFFAPHAAYGAAGSADIGAIADEFRALVKAFHQADIEVILDVVYNHTAEQGADGPTLSFRGIDNSTYYALTPDLRSYVDMTGTGNTLRTTHPAVRQLVVESLRYWVQEMHVDGFRFDLAAVFTRRDDGSLDLDAPPILSELSADPELGNVRLIAEPWALGAYELGRAFPGVTWLQWNGRFRDDVRGFLKSDPALVPAVMRRMYGSDDLFPDTPDVSYRPWQSVNFVTCHDGFCLYDLVSYDRKHNEANGRGSRDGSDDNRSWNCGFEGDVGAPPQVLALRRQQVKNACVLLLLANGTPMFVAGDELLRTQHGNNNPYNQDNETSWIDWSLAVTNRDVLRFWTAMIAFRRAHPTLGRSGFWRDAVRWYGVDGPTDLSDDSRSFAFFLDGAAVGDVDLYVMVNAYWDDLTFRIQESSAEPWRRVVDTARASPDDIIEPGSEVPVTSEPYVVRGRSVVVLMR